MLRVEKQIGRRTRMLRLILFWLIRILAVGFFATNLAYVSSNGLWGVVAVGLGIFACINLYLWGWFCRETNKKLPSLFILLRVLQGMVSFFFDAMPMSYFATYFAMDVIFYAILFYDSRFKFIYLEEKTEKNSKIRREEV